MNKQGGLLSIIGIISLFVIGLITMNMLGWLGGASQVAHEEFGAKAMLTKYEWFKDADAQLVKKEQDTIAYQSKINSMKDFYGNSTPQEWSRQDREQLWLWESELTGVISSYNYLCQEYNSQSNKFNWDKFKTSELQRSCIVK